MNQFYLDEPEIPVTYDLIVHGMEEIFEHLNLQTETTLNGWLKTFKNMTNLVSHIPEFINQFDESSATGVTISSIEVLNILIEKPKIWNNFPIMERAQHAQGIYASIGFLSVLMNTMKLEKTINQTNIQFQSKSFKLIQDVYLEFVFSDKFSVQIPSDGLTYSTPPRNNTIFASAVLVQNLDRYLSFDYFVNSHILKVTIENKDDLNHTIWFE